MNEKKLERYLYNLPKKVIFCKKCVLSNQRPRIKFIDGVCSACIHHEKKPKVNWEEKSEELEVILEKYRSKKGEWDV